MNYKALKLVVQAMVNSDVVFASEICEGAEGVAYLTDDEDGSYISIHQCPDTEEYVVGYFDAESCIIVAQNYSALEEALASIC